VQRSAKSGVGAVLVATCGWQLWAAGALLLPACFGRLEELEPQRSSAPRERTVQAHTKVHGAAGTTTGAGAGARAEASAGTKASAGAGTPASRSTSAGSGMKANAGAGTKASAGTKTSAGADADPAPMAQAEPDAHAEPEADGGVEASPRPSANPSPNRGTPSQRGLLASDGFVGQPVKAVYFFPGDVGEYNEGLYTAHPTEADDAHWSSDAALRQRVIARISATHANTLFMSYWGDEMRRWSPMLLNDTSIPDTIAAVSGQEVLIVPSLESGFAEDTDMYWRFSDDFPYQDGDLASLAPALIARLRTVVALFRPNMQHWARMYDRTGTPRYVVHIMHAYAHAVPQVPGKTADEVIADAFDRVAEEIAQSEGIEIGFTLDPIPGTGSEHSLRPAAGPALEQANSVLAIAGFISEIFSGRVQVSEPNGEPIDNNVSNLDALLAWKREHIEDWVRSGVPVIYDVSSGYDGRYVWEARGTFFWGDNEDYTFDEWRNALSAMKGLGAVGITFNTWNGYTEGFAATPTLEHGDTVYRWLTDLYAVDPRECSHIDYVDGRAATPVRGAVCEKWRDMHASRGGLGAPLQAEADSARGRVQHFESGSIFVGERTGVHEVHGAIHSLYAELGYDASCLGLPTSDEQAAPAGRVSHFEGGDIVFEDGAARSTCN
jgi:hypothetical protein